MPQITAIEPQKKKPSRFNLFIDGQFAAGVSDFTVAENHLKVGLSLPTNEISRIILKEEFSKLMDKALRFLAFRPRSEKEIIAYLAQKIAKSGNIKYHQAKESLLIGQITARLKRYKYLNDREFAAWWVLSRIKSNPKGPVALRFELLKKGIDKEIVEAILQKLPNQTTLATNAISKKLKTWRKLNSLDLKKKVYAYLVSRGFQFQTVKEVFAKLNQKR